MNGAVSETLKCPLKELRGGWPAEKTCTLCSRGSLIDVGGNVCIMGR